MFFYLCETFFFPVLFPHFRVSLSEFDMKTKVKCHWLYETFPSFFPSLSILSALRPLFALRPFDLRITWSMLATCSSFFSYVHHFIHAQGLAHTMQDALLNVQMNEINAMRLLPCNMKVCSSPPFGNSPGKNLHSYFHSLVFFLYISDFTFLHKYITKCCKFSGTHKIHQIFQQGSVLGRFFLNADGCVCFGNLRNHLWNKR